MQRNGPALSLDAEAEREDHQVEDLRNRQVVEARRELPRREVPSPNRMSRLYQRGTAVPRLGVECHRRRASRGPREIRRRISVDHRCRAGGVDPAEFTLYQGEKRRLLAWPGARRFRLPSQRHAAGGDDDPHAAGFGIRGDDELGPHVFGDAQRRADTEGRSVSCTTSKYPSPSRKRSRGAPRRLYAAGIVSRPAPQHDRRTIGQMERGPLSSSGDDLAWRGGLGPVPLRPACDSSARNVEPTASTAAAAVAQGSHPRKPWPRPILTGGWPNQRIRRDRWRHAASSFQTGAGSPGSRPADRMAPASARLSALAFTQRSSSASSSDVPRALT